MLNLTYYFIISLFDVEAQVAGMTLTQTVVTKIAGGGAKFLPFTAVTDNVVFRR